MTHWVKFLTCFLPKDFQPLGYKRIIHGGSSSYFSIPFTAPDLGAWMNLGSERFFNSKG